MRTTQLIGGIAHVVSTQTGGVAGTYTLTRADAGTVLRVDRATGVTVTVPTIYAVDLPVGTTIDVEQAGVGAVTFVGGSNVVDTITYTAVVDVIATKTLVTAGKFGVARLTKVNNIVSLDGLTVTDLWIVTGDLAAV